MRIASALLLLVAPVSSQAATVDISVRGADGKPLAGAVVFVDTPRKPAAPVRFAWGTEMAQRNIAFDPHVLIVPTGSTVTFPNKDKVRHHVYSFSKVKAFNLKLYGRDQVPTVVFDKPGIVALGCNIHDSMSGFIVVADTPFAMQTDAAGHVSIPDVPAGGATLRLWHPAIRASGNMLSQTVVIAPTGYSTTLVVHGK
ncbi:methylamine utilization protein [Sphingomonas sp. QA11]|uniref:methylamine utilization protein n=1 Tax=Sphingomonas sp. QA11 TaxID=2950605 RepID=UPI00234B4348|nr:methylamine utilization protein [Sphingomonas sp. QA11]WCM28942.1 methylamine utilization protein [Sphingomonas sp. QA11]